MLIDTIHSAKRKIDERKSKGQNVNRLLKKPETLKQQVFYDGSYSSMLGR